MTDSLGFNIKVRALERKDNRAEFHSGNIELDRFFQRYAGQNQFKHYIGTTYIALINHPDLANKLDNKIAGFVTISASEIMADSISITLKKRLPSYPLPVLRLSRLAVEQNFQGNGIGKLLLKTAFKLALEMRDKYGCIGVLVDAKAEAVAFYQHYGFIQLELTAGELGDRPQPVAMFLPLSVLDDL